MSKKVELSDFENETFETTEDGRKVTIKQIVGGSGIYLIVRDSKTGELIRNTTPWQWG